jgi:hypothetical protein
MEPLADHLQELSYEYNRAAGFEKRFVYDSIIGQAFTQVEDHHTGERYNVFPKEGEHPRLTFDRPQTQHIVHLGETALSEEGRGSE